MVWSTNHDVLLCREILVIELYRYTVGTRERGQAWDKVASALNLVEGLRFAVDHRHRIRIRQKGNSCQHL